MSQTPLSTVNGEHSPDLHYFLSMVTNIQRRQGRGLGTQEKGLEQEKGITPLPVYHS